VGKFLPGYLSGRTTMRFNGHFVLAALSVVLASPAAALDQDVVKQELAAVNRIQMR